MFDRIRVFPDRNKWTPDDPLAFVGEPPLFRPGTPNTPVMVSVTFTWWRKRAEQIADSWRVFYRNVMVGGPAYDDPGSEFTPGMFLKSGCTITSRGCPKKCGWCKVPFSEGALRLLDIKPGWIVQDNNLLATPEHHFAGVFEMLREQNRAVSFNGGLDKHYLKPWHVSFFDSIKIRELWWACDVPDDFKFLIKARELFAHIPQSKMRCYTMFGYDGESLVDAERRIEKVYELGFLPFSQLYQPPTADVPTKIYGADWKAVNRKWSRPAIYKGVNYGRTTEFTSGLFGSGEQEVSGEGNDGDK